MQDSNDSKTNKGRKPTGTIQRTADGRWRARITLADKSRKWLPPFPPGTSETMAREKAAHYAEQALKIDLRRADKPPTNMRKLAARAGKSCDGWVELWNADRERRGLTSARVSDSHWTTYIKTILGSKHPREWARDDFRRLSKFLDGKVRDSVCTWKTATNVWGTATKMADDACNAKDDAIRCQQHPLPPLRKSS